MKTIPLSQGLEAIVDDDDYEWLSSKNWHCDSKGYACRYVSVAERGSSYKPEKQKMHRVILEKQFGLVPSNMMTDHINGDRLDNRKMNLRICNRSQNAKNRKLNSNNKSGFKGVRWYPYGGLNKWQALIRHNKQLIHLGYFTEMADAVNAYNVASQKYHREFRRESA